MYKTTKNKTEKCVLSQEPEWGYAGSLCVTEIRAQIRQGCKWHKIYYESSLLFINCSICFLVIL